MLPHQHMTQRVLQPLHRLQQKTTQTGLPLTTTQPGTSTAETNANTYTDTAIGNLDTDGVEEGISNLYYTTGRAKEDAADLLTSATKTNITITGDQFGLTITAENGVADSDTDDLTEGVTNLYFTNQRALDATSSAYDASGAASTVQGNLDDHASDTSTHGVTGAIVGTSDIQTLSNKAIDGSLEFGVNGSQITDTDGVLVVEASGDLNIESNSGDIILNADGNLYKGSATSANVITTQGRLDQFIGDVTVDGSTGNTITDRIATAVSDLVDGAPALLDTLNELAAAINDDASFATTITTSIGEKVAKSGDTMTGELVLAADPTQALAAATKQYVDSAASGAYNDAIAQADTTAQGYANTAENNAEAYADSLAVNYEPAGAVSTAINALDTDDIEEGSSNLYFTDARAIDAVSAADIYPNAVIVNNVSKTVANTQSVATASTVSGITWAKADYRSAKLVVKASTATHSQVSEIMVTLDSLDNVAITEFGIVYTDTELATVTADVSGTDVRVRVTTLNATTAVTVVGTLLV